MRTIRYREIAADLRDRIDDGEFRAGGLLPSEAALSGAYNASRVTIRKALEELRGDGLVGSRQGFGWFVAAETVQQPLAHLATIEAQLESEGRRSARKVLDFAFVDAPGAVRDVLGVGRVLEVRRLNLADGQPFARVTVWCPETIGSVLSRDQVERASFYDALAGLGIRLVSATQTIGADAAGVDDASLLNVPVGSPVLVCRRVTFDEATTALLLSEYVFPAHRTEFTVELSDPEASIAPSGLRLVEDRRPAGGDVTAAN
ncbi:MAG: GntR family transcriptional regulator [Acidimicrobiales bacterium]|nr:GntR family transcriptional regulator [Acidimicrobiales bacterium]